MTELTEDLARSLIRDAEQGDRDAVWERLQDLIVRPSADEKVRFALRIFRDHRFIEASASSGFLTWLSVMVFDLREGRAPLKSDVSPVLRGEIVDALRVSFGRYADPQSKHVVGVILGEQLADATSLDALVELAQSDAAADRDEIAHALHHLAIDAPDPDVRAAGEARLRQMADDPDEDVRKSVAVFIGQIDAGEAI